MKYVVDPHFVACDHHLYMSVGLKSALKNKDNGETVIIGLGGGGLCTFIRQYITQVIQIFVTNKYIIFCNNFKELSKI